jgi:hypothetical protein
MNLIDPNNQDWFNHVDGYDFKLNSGIVLNYIGHLDCGGTKSYSDYITVLQQLNKGQYKRAYEWCAGIGAVGFEILGQGLCEHVVFSDYYDLAIENCYTTAEKNNIRNKVTGYTTPRIGDIPDTEIWDLVVGNASAAYNTANGAYVVANAAFNAANTGTSAGPAYKTANAAYAAANQAGVIANAAFDKANTGGGGGGGSSNSFTTISVSGQSNIVAAANDTLNFAGANGINISTDSVSKTVTIIAAPALNFTDYGSIAGPITTTQNYGSL